jgi:hypothetical protein
MFSISRLITGKFMIELRRLEQLLHAPWKISKKDLSGLDKISSEYPWYQTIQLLRLYGCYKFHPTEYNRQIRLLPSLIINPAVLQQWISDAENEQSAQNEPIPQNNAATHQKSEVINLTNPATPTAVEEMANIETDANEISDLSTPTAITTDTHETENISQTEEVISPSELLQHEIEKQSAQSRNELELLNLNKTSSPISSESSAGTSVNTEKEKNLTPEPKTFLEWIHSLSELSVNVSTTSFSTKNEEKKSVPVSDKEEKISETKRKKQQIIDKIIQSNPGPIKIKSGEASLRSFPLQEKNAKESLLDSEDFVTETLAMLYLEQGHFSKAIRVYEILSLKIPSKSAYFAEKIESIKKQLKS